MATPRLRPRSLTEILFTRDELDRAILDARRTEAILIASHIRAKLTESTEEIARWENDGIESTVALDGFANPLADSIERQEYRS